MKLGIITAAAFASFSAACIASGVMPTDGTSAPSTDAVATGQASIVNHQCASCHGENMSGQTTVVPFTTTYGSNITVDTATGIGSWTDEEIIRSIRQGKDTKGQLLCESMPRYTLSDSEVVAEVAYLRSLAAVAHSIPVSVCATKGGDAGPPPPPVDDSGTTDPDSSTTGTCAGYADPSTKASCHSCKSSTCQSNGCYGGYYCDLNATKCVVKPSGC